MRKKLLCVFFVFIMALALCVTTYADDVEIITGGDSPFTEGPPGEVETSADTTGEREIETEEWQAIQALAYEQIYSKMPTVTSSDILNWATTKGNEIIYILQIIAQPFAIVIFIIAAFMTLIGCIGKSDMIGKGVLGMILSMVIYVCILYSPVILQSFSGWMSS